MPKVDWEDAQSSSDVHPCLGNSSFISWDRLNRPFFCSHNCSQVAVDCTKTPPDVCVRSSLLALSSVILAALAANLHPFLASLLNCSSISSFLNLCSIPKKTSKVPLYPLMYFLFALPTEPVNNAHLKFFSSFLTSFPSTPSAPPEGICHPGSRKCLPSDTIMISGTSASPFGSSLPAAASTQKQFCIRIKRRKSHLPDLTRNCFVLGLLFLSLPFFLQIFFFPFRHKEARKLFFALCPPKISSVLHFFIFFLCFLFHFFSCRFFWTRHLLTGASRVLGSFLWLFIWDVPTFTVFYQGYWVLTLAVSFLGACVPSLSVFFNGSCVLSPVF